jgi:predicted HD phosphohydrolase
MNQVVSFRQMKDGTREDYALLEHGEREYERKLPDRLFGALEKLKSALPGYQVTRYEHSLQAATRAWRDGADDELIVAALLHDIGDDLAPYNHAEVAASVIRPYVRAEVTWIVEQHGIFQSYYYAHHYGKNRNLRDQFRDHRWYTACASFCERWDQSSFDPDYKSEPLSRFEPLVRAIFARPPHDPAIVGREAY